MNEPSVENVIEKGQMQGVGSGTLVMPPFQRGRTGRKGCTKYIQMQTGSWVTLNADGSCHIGAWHKHLGDLRDVGREIEQRKEYADAWRIHMLQYKRERDEAYDYLAALWKNGQLPAPMPETLRDQLSLHNTKVRQEPQGSLSVPPS